MGTTPSSVDTTLYEKILDQLDDTMFYIFLIYNKRGEKTYKIYDMAKNVLFETADVTVKIIGKDYDLEAFLKDAKSKVTDRTYSYGNTYSAGNNQTRQIGVVAQQPAKVAAPATPASTAAGNVTQIPVKTATQKQEEKKNPPSFGLRKGKRKNKNDASTVKGSGSYSNASFDENDMYGYDGYDDPYGPYGWRDGRWY